jgi:hypothetical protein
MREKIARAAAAISRLRLVRPRFKLLMLVQLAGLGAIAYGIAMISLPAALIVAGIGAVLWSQGAER